MQCDSPTSADRAARASRRRPFRRAKVAYVKITTATDGLGAPGEYPDPLPPLTPNWTPAAGRNNPLWITVAVPADARARGVLGAHRARGAWLAARCAAAPARVGICVARAHRAEVGLRLLGRVHPKVPRAEIRRRDDQRLGRLHARLRRATASRPTTRWRSPATASSAPMAASRRPPWKWISRFSTGWPGAISTGWVFNSFVISFSGLGAGRHPKYDEGSFLDQPSTSPVFAGGGGGGADEGLRTQAGGSPARQWLAAEGLRLLVRRTGRGRLCVRAPRDGAAARARAGSETHADRGDAAAAGGQRGPVVPDPRRLLGDVGHRAPTRRRGDLVVHLLRPAPAFLRRVHRPPGHRAAHVALADVEVRRAGGAHLGDSLVETACRRGRPTCRTRGTTR